MRLPTATYRLQLGPGMGFREARQLVPYLHALGISDVYASPLLQARPGSRHGYDVTDPSRLNPELGTEAVFDALADELAARGMGLVADIVPNHMAAGADNPWWRSVLEHGSASPYAAFFDIDWRPSHSPLENQVLLPILGEHYGRALESGLLELEFDETGFVVRYYDHVIPLGPATWVPLLEDAARELAGRADPERVAALARVASRLAELDAAPARTPQARAARLAAAEAARRDLATLAREDAAVRDAIARVVECYRGRPGDPRSFDRLDRLLSEQAYALSAWRTATEEINYRRFFDIGDLISVRAEDPAVFEAMHALILRLVARGRITGLRIDHVDGLHDPEAYLRTLVERLGAPPGGPPPCYLVVEKILAADEALPASWPAHGTTGYDFLNTVNGLFVHPDGLARIRRDYARFTGDARAFDAVAFESKRKVIRELFAGDVRSLEWRLIRLARQDRHGRDIPGQELAAAIAAVTAGLGVYRTYVRSPEVSRSDRARIEAAVARARAECPTIDPAALDFLRRVLLLDLPADAPAARRRAWLAFVQRWQQFTGPITAKGIEDTALYVHNPLTSLNEVGGDPGDGAVSVDEFHRRMAARLAAWPASLSATTTHDTKRAEAVRARIDVLSDVPGTWLRQLRQWARMNAALKPVVAGQPVPDPAMEVLLYQALLGVWPLDAAGREGLLTRMERYAVKAAREAKAHTGWVDVDEAYEEALVAFLRRILDPAPGNRFLERFAAFHERIAAWGAQNALSQTLIKAAAPGVADVYQGTELWSFTLVDPDNRGPVDFDARARALAEIDARVEEEGGVAVACSLLEAWRDGRVHLFVLSRLLRYRRERPELFVGGEYLPIAVAGRWREHVCAFARRHGDGWAVAVAPRLVARIAPPGRFALGAAWGRTHLVLPAGAPREWRDVVTGAVLEAVDRRGHAAIPLARALEHLPVALLAAEG